VVCRRGDPARRAVDRSVAPRAARRPRLGRLRRRADRRATFSDHSAMGNASTSTAASSFFVDGRTSALRPGMSASVMVSRAWRFASCSVITWHCPNSTALRYRIDDSNAERATTRASKAVTARQVGAPAARRRSQREPVEPCASTRSPSRTMAVGSTTGWAASTVIAKCPMWTVSSKRSSVARSLLALRDSRVIDVLLTGRV